uniref:F-box domain-containing protein n=1 Tax=Strongyloides venezuelensis TaxID=75913 RepID=A0A0K0G1V4_STRVS
MDTESEYPTFPLTLLPNEIIKVVLEKVDWATLYNFRLVSKFFNAMILKDFNRFNKPKMNEFKVYSQYENNGMIKIRYFIICELGMKKLERSYSNEAERDVLVEEYLNKVNLKHIKNFDIAVNSYSPVFKIIIDSFDYGTSVENFYFIINNSPVFKDFYNFLKKLNYIGHIYANKLCLSHSEIPPDISLPILHTLRHLFIVECECTKFINPTMMNNLFKYNKNLNALAIYSKTTSFEEDIIRNIKRRHDHCTHEPNNHKETTINLARRSDYNKEREFHRFFPCGTYPMTLDLPIFNSIKVNKKCNECNCNNLISIYFLHMDGYMTHNYS